MNRFEWLKVYFSPFKVIKPKLYFGKVTYGTPYFLPRTYNKETEKWERKKIGFDFVSLGWKTKWEDTDVRYEWSPLWSFVFFGWQIAIIFVPIESNHYWECWLIYYLHTEKKLPVKERLKKAKEIFPCKWRRYDGINEKKTICYWDYILKNRYNESI